MINAAGIMKPLPVRPLDGPRGTGMPAPLHRPHTTGTMHPLPVPKPDVDALADAIRAAAFQRLQECTIAG